VAPAGIYKSREGHVVIVPVGDDMWRRLTRAIGRACLRIGPASTCVEAAARRSTATPRRWDTTPPV